MVRSYAETRSCRRQLLLCYFGEPYEPPCGACDNCENGAIAADTPFLVGTRVVHRSLGEGTVTGAEDGKLVVLFDDRGYTTLATDLVLEQGLLAPASPSADLGP